MDAYTAASRAGTSKTMKKLLWLRVVAVIGWQAAAGVAIRSQADSPVTFARDVAPLVYRHCAPCHRPDGPAPFSLMTAEDARRRAGLIAQVTRSRYMPPWRPEPGGGFVGERRLTDTEIAIIERWVAGGSRPGNAADLPSPPHFTPGWQLGEPDLVVSLPEYVLRPDGPDQFRNFVVPVPT